MLTLLLPVIYEQGNGFTLFGFRAVKKRAWLERERFGYEELFGEFRHRFVHGPNRILLMAFFSSRYLIYRVFSNLITVFLS